MFGFGTKNPDFSYVAILDIASGSVGTAIYEFAVASSNAKPKAIFQNRILLTAQATADAEQPSLRAVKEALLTSLLELNSRGITELQSIAPGAAISDVSVSVAAPWAHIVPREISYADDELFTVSEALIAELKASAEEQAEDVLNESNITQNQQLRVINRQVTSVTANGYPLRNGGVGVETPELTISMSSCFVREDILKVIDEVVEKIFPHTDVRYTSFVQAFQKHIRTVQPKNPNVFLVDITGEATEVALIAEHKLKMVTFAPNGIHTTARFIAETEEIPVNEALTYLKNLEEIILENSAKTITQAAIAYQHTLERLLGHITITETIPVNVYLLSNEPMGSFFTQTLTETLKNSDHTTHTVRKIEKKLLPVMPEEGFQDVRLAMIAHFFHN